MGVLLKKETSSTLLQFLLLEEVSKSGINQVQIPYEQPEYRAVEATVWFPARKRKTGTSRSSRSGLEFDVKILDIIFSQLENLCVEVNAG